MNCFFYPPKKTPQIHSCALSVLTPPPLSFPPISHILLGYPTSAPLACPSNCNFSRFTHLAGFLDLAEAPLHPKVPMPPAAVILRTSSVFRVFEFFSFTRFFSFFKPLIQPSLSFARRLLPCPPTNLPLTLSQV